MNSTYFLLIIGVVACFVQSANSILCYKCEGSADDPTCGKHVDPGRTRSVDCRNVPVPHYIASAFQRDPWTGNIQANDPNYNLPATGCLKRTLQRNNEKRYQRDCFYGDIRNTTRGCMVDPSRYDTQLSCDVCVTNECNDSTSIVPTAATFLVLIAAFLAKKLF